MPKRTSRTPTGRRHGQRRDQGVVSSTSEFEKIAANRASRAKYALRLYIAGISPRSSRAIANVRRICDEHLSGRYELQIIDLYQNPVLSKGEQIVAVPTLVKKLPAPLRKFIGDMSDTDRILVGLDLRPKGE